MEKRLLINADYLYLPIKGGKEEKLMEVFLMEEDRKTKVMEWMIPVNDEEGRDYTYDYKAQIPVKTWKGKCLVLEGDMPENFWKEVDHTSFLHKQSKSNTHRPNIHFTADTGWINDPNGLVFSEGKYHLYFQYNPCNISWQNMSWGHAVSSDLLHWKQEEIALVPDEHGTMFSGCGLKNEKGLLGLPSEALVFFYTAAGAKTPWGKEERHFTQRVAYSLDGGKTLVKMEKPYLEMIESENRDPKIFWHEETSAYIMTLWLEGNDFAIFRSKDLECWEMSDRFTLSEAWECPDLMKLYSEDGEAHWLFWSADGFYYWGDFDGYHFKTDGVQHKAYINKLAYAAQTYSGVEGRTITVPWLRTSNKGRLYTGAMGLPRELSVKVIEGEKYLVQRAVRELAEQRKLIWQKKEENTEVADQEKVYVYQAKEGQERKAIQMEMTLEEDYKGLVRWQINGTAIRYDTQTGELTVDETVYPIGKNQHSFTLLVDGDVFEVTADHDIMTGMFELREDSINILLELENLKELDVYEIL